MAGSNQVNINESKVIDSVQMLLHLISGSTLRIIKIANFVSSFAFEDRGITN